MRKRLALCCHTAVLYSLFLWYKNIPHIPVSSAHCCQSRFTLQKSLDNTSNWTERERARTNLIEFGNDCSDVAKQPNIPQWKRPLPSLFLFSSCFPCRFLSVSLSHFPTLSEKLAILLRMLINLEILPCLSEACETLLRVGHDYCSSSFQMYTTVSS